MYSPIHVNGEVFTLEHLAPITRPIQLELRGGLRKQVDVEFRFSSHCYSRGLAHGEIAPAGLEVPDGSAHQPRPRVFDRERYQLSRQLVGLIDQLIQSNGPVSKTRHENFYRIDHVETTRAGVERTVAYFVFFHARKVQAPNRPKSLLVWVESAYPEQDGIPHPQGQGRRSLAAMLGEKW